MIPLSKGLRLLGLRSCVFCVLFPNFCAQPSTKRWALHVKRQCTTVNSQ